VAEDLVQELLLSIHSSRHTFDCNRPFAPWLFAIARKRIADYWRSEWQRINREVSEYDGVNEIPKSSAASSNGMTDYVSIAMEELPERQKNVITLLKVNGYSLKEAADKLKMTEGAVKVTAHRAYNALRKKLEIKIYEHE
jgi:RNA polymerase sigma-70 factor (ECF subfamily)